MVVDKLTELADLELSQSHSLLNGMDELNAAVFIIEACRALDYFALNNLFSDTANTNLKHQDFNIMLRGWNPLMGSQLKKLGQIDGIPILESTQETIGQAAAELHRLGRSVLLRKTADLMKRGLLQGVQSDEMISIKMDSRKKNDLFVDRLAEGYLADLDKAYFSSMDAAQNNVGKIDSEKLKHKLGNMVFPWRSPQATMIGYHAVPDVDEHYLACVLEHVMRCRDASGLHPEARFKGILISDISAIVLLIFSTRLKHTQLVSAGKRKYPEANYWMSLTVWKPKSEIVESLSEYSGIDRFIVSAVIDMLTLHQSSSPDLSSDVDPVLPLFIRISKQHLLAPVSMLMTNPFDTLLHINADEKFRKSVISKREQIMISNVLALFQGNRYWRLDTPVRLKKAGKTVTDIDTAVFDRETGTLALFQLKWQDFRGSNNKQLVSRAKNFTQSVDKWADALDDWLKDHDLERLCRSLQIPIEANRSITNVHLFAIGQSASSFKYLGYSVDNANLAVTTWAQFVRLRHDLGPASSVLGSLHESIRKGSFDTKDPIPMPYEMDIDGVKVRFENLWNAFN